MIPQKRKLVVGRKLLIWLLVISFLFTQFIISPLFAQSTGTGRLAGGDRYETAVAVSQKGWKTSEYAVLARGDHFADALCAGPLAQKYSGPILLTPPNKLNSSTLQELKRLGVKHLFIAGGLGAVSQNVEDALKANGIAVIERIYGNDRYETAVKIAEKIGINGKAVLATGSDFPDALSISVIAAKTGMPILLTGKDTIPDVVKNYLVTNTISQTYLIGGSGVISSGVENQVPNPYRLAGNNRYETNVVIMQHFADSLNFENIYVAIGGGQIGNEFADALTGAVLAAKTSSPLILAGQTIPAGTADFLKGKILLSSKVTGLGGQKVIPSSALTSIVAFKEQISVTQKYSTAGTYGPETGTATISGSVTICAADVTLQNTIIEGDLLLAQSIGDGNVALRNVTVKGKTIINGGGPNSVIMYNFNGVTVVVDVPEGSRVRLVAQGNTTVANVSMEGNGMLQESELSGSGFVNVAIPAGAQVTLSGNFQQVNVEGTGANVTVANGSITTLSIPENAVGAQVNLASTATVNTLNVNATANITGQGQITNANITANGVTIEQNPMNTTVSPGTITNVGGLQQTGSSPPPSSGGGDSGPSSTTVSAITGADVLLRSGSIVMGYNFETSGVPISYSQAISNTYGLDLVNSNVTLAVKVGDVYNQVGNTVPLSSLTISDSNERGETAKVTFIDFATLLTTFGLDFSNPANVPTHVKVVVRSKTSINGQSVTNPWGPIDSDWVLIDNNLITPISAAKSGASLLAGNKTAGFTFPVSITLKDALDNDIPDGTYGVAIYNGGQDPIGGGQTVFANGQADVNALLAAAGTYSLTVKVNNITIETIENVTAVASPVLEEVESSMDGAKLNLTFSKPMADPSGKHAQFSITVNGTSNSVTAAELKSGDNEVIELTLTTPLAGSETITVAYTRGDVISADGGILCTFTPFVVGGSSDTAVTSKNNGEGQPHYAVTTDAVSMIPADNFIVAAATPITTSTTVGTLLSNLNLPANSEYKVFASAHNPYSGEPPVNAVANFRNNTSKASGETLALFDGVNGFPDFLFVLAQDGATLRGYRIHVGLGGPI